MEHLILIRNDPDGANYAFERVRSRIGDAPWLQTYFGLVMHAQRQLDKAEAKHRITVQAYFGDSWPMINLALVLDAKGEPQEALELYRKALSGRKAAVLDLFRAIRPDWATRCSIRPVRPWACRGEAGQSESRMP